jgi:hypothetical protein
MILRLLILAVFATLLAGGCCATGANDIEATNQATRLNLPN